MSQTKQVIHETSGNGGRHRLIILRDGIPVHSDWHEAREVGLFHGIYFHVGGAGETVPTVFRVSAVAAEVL